MLAILLVCDTVRVAQDAWLNRCNLNTFRRERMSKLFARVNKYRHDCNLLRRAIPSNEAWMLQKSHTNSVPLMLIGLSCCHADGHYVRRKTAIARTEHHEGTNFANENNCRPLLRAASSEFGVTASSYYDAAVLPPWITKYLSLFLPPFWQGGSER